MILYFTTNDDRTHITGKTSANDLDLEARASGLYVEAFKLSEPREHWTVRGTFCGEPIFSFRCALDEQVRERAQAAVDVEREMVRPDTHSVDWPLAMAAPVSETTELRKRLAAAGSEADALRSALLASKASP